MNTHELILICLGLIAITIVGCFVAVNNINITPKEATTILQDCENELTVESAFSAELIDENNQPLANKNIKISGLAGEEINSTTDANGEISYSLNDVSPGEYDVYCIFEGDSDYEPSNLTCTITIKNAGPKYPADWYESYHHSDYEIDPIPNSKALAHYYELALMEAPDGTLWIIAGDGYYKFIY